MAACDPTISERAYHEIKRQVLAGEFHLRQRLDATAIAQNLGFSTTPVREALVRLAGERLVMSRPTHGFFISVWTESGLRSLYLWRSALVRQGVEQFGEAVLRVEDGTSHYPERVVALLSAFHVGANPEMVRAAANADDRLHRARYAEADVWPNALEELQELESSLVCARVKVRLSLLGKYHSNRADAARLIRERTIVREQPPNGV